MLRKNLHLGLKEYIPPDIFDSLTGVPVGLSSNCKHRQCFPRGTTEMLTRTPADIDSKMKIKTKQGFGVNLGMVSLKAVSTNLDKFRQFRQILSGHRSYMSYETE